MEVILEAAPSLELAEIILLQFRCFIHHLEGIWLVWSSLSLSLELLEELELLFNLLVPGFLLVLHIFDVNVVVLQLVEQEGDHVVLLELEPVVLGHPVLEELSHARVDDFLILAIWGLVLEGVVDQVPEEGEDDNDLLLVQLEIVGLLVLLNDGVGICELLAGFKGVKGW